MSEVWKERAADLGGIIRGHAEIHPELEPLLTSWINFSRKHGLDGVEKVRVKRESEGVGLLEKALEEAGLIVVSGEKYLHMQAQINGHVEEIEALEYRIKTLLER